MAGCHSLIFLAYPPARQLMARAEGSSREQAFGLRPPRIFRCEFRRDPPERLLIAPLYSGGQSGEVVWDASISFGFLGVCSFAVFPSG